MRRFFPASILLITVVFCAGTIFAQTSTDVSSQSSTSQASPSALATPEPQAAPAPVPKPKLTETFPEYPKVVPDPGTPKDRMFFPHDWIYGYAEFDVAPPHNEPDPNFCAANAGDYGGVNSQCNAFARYLLKGEVIVRPFGRGVFRRFKLEATPIFAFGKNVPQYLYTWSWDPIGWERTWAAAIDLPKGFDFRVTQQFLFQRIGSRDQYLGPAYLGPNGPWGRYTTLGVRKNFGKRWEN